MTEAVLVAGSLLQGVAWRLVATGRSAFWPTSAATWAVVGLAAVLAAPPACCDDASTAVALGVGVAAGAALYVATRAVVAVATRLPGLAAAVGDVYARSRETSPAVLWAVTLLLVVPGEELFWRGLVVPDLGASVGAVPGAILAWLAAVAVTALWADLPFLAAAVVGGAVWTALAAWSGGVVAPLASHLVWTAAMVAWRPGAARAKVPG
jgi:membrane protease YdiL (CAAX protease family)